MAAITPQRRCVGHWTWPHQTLRSLLSSRSILFLGFGQSRLRSDMRTSLTRPVNVYLLPLMTSIQLGGLSAALWLHGARQALAVAGADADLIVVGPRGIGGVARTILGSGDGLAVA